MGLKTWLLVKTSVYDAQKPHSHGKTTLLSQVVRPEKSRAGAEADGKVPN